MGKRKNVIVSGTDDQEAKTVKKVKNIELPAGEAELELPAGESELELAAGQEELALEAPEQRLVVTRVKKQTKKKEGKKYAQAKSMIDSSKQYTLSEAIDLVKKTSVVKFDSTVEAHFHLGIDPENQDQRIRTTVTLPNGTGKTVKVLVFADEVVDGADMVGDEALISKLQSGEVKPGAGFDVIVATPAWMSKMAKLGPILGPSGLLPSPKNGTVTTDPAQAVANLKKGQVELKSELKAPLLHTIIGRVSFSSQALEENFKSVLATVQTVRPSKVKQGDYIKSITLCSTMGPGVKVAVSG